MFERIKRFYNQNLWTKNQVYLSVGAKAITPDEYFLITGEVYVAPQN